jgi:hypothetical protein
MSNKIYVDKDEHRHWCPVSEPFTGFDALLSAFDQGWRLCSFYCQKRTWLMKERRVCVYYFTLKYDDRIATMAVINTPRLEQYLQKSHLYVVDADASDSVYEVPLYSPVLVFSK